MKDVVAHFKKLNGATGWGEWEVDQVFDTFFFILFFVRLNIYLIVADISPTPR